MIALKTFRNIHGGQFIELKLHDPALIVLDDTDAEVEKKVRAVSSREKRQGPADLR